MNLQLGCTSLPVPLPLELGCINGMTYNGCDYIFLIQSNRIAICDPCHCKLETVCAKRNYTSICFDCCEKCYWCLANRNASLIYQLDLCFHEIKTIVIKNACGRCANGISCDPCKNQLWIALPDSVAYLKKGCYDYCYIENECTGTYNKAISYAGNHLFLAYSECGRQFIDAMETDSYAVITSCVPKGYLVNSMCCICQSQDCHNQTCKLTISILLSRACDHTAYAMMDYSLSACPYKGDPCCHDGCCPPDCDPCCCDPCCADRCCYGASCQIIQSIALEEAAISHILNAEGEKIQRAVAECGHLDDLLRVNESVKQTITRLTQLEMQLFLKLECVQDCICKGDDSHGCICPGDCPHDCSCHECCDPCPSL